MSNQKIIIGLSGSPAAGKDTVANFLENKKKFQHISLSKILRTLMTKEGFEINLENLTNFGNSLIDRFGEGFLAKKAIEQFEDKNIVVSSIRQPGEIKQLRRMDNFKMIFVDADIKIRYNRLEQRKRIGDNVSFDQFQEIENKQLSGSSGGMDLNQCKIMADYVITNNDGIEVLEQEIEKILSKINKGE